MSNHQIRQEKWEAIQENLDKSSELLSEVQNLADELREDYSYSNAASERREKLDELHSDVEQALAILEKAQELLNSK
jgi:Zn-dependent oligopeptidase